MFEDQKGPIQRFEWGQYTIGGAVHGKGGYGVGKDIRLIGTEVSGWAERNGHKLTAEMITGVYGQGIEVLFIGCGVEEIGRASCRERV